MGIQVSDGRLSIECSHSGQGECLVGEGERKDWSKLRKFLGCPVVRTPCFQCSGPGFHSWLGNEDPTS